ncbi:QcrA and Rieske domain-containing protein [Myceligenerans salitolerans]|uniref:QcrA and Rieske domain-containing protein n=1 Tax=Myceligenerans salitolerans TaxID=1230528 RepID=UPI0027DBB1E4|nr:Rieske (2Fe-2S) protein [Myceligenerans salitolerans]
MTHTRPGRSQAPAADALAAVRALSAPASSSATDEDPTRREILRGAGAVCGALAGGIALAACSGGGRQQPGTGPVAPGLVVVPLGDVPVGGAVSATIDGQEVLVTRPAEDEVHAFSATCTHQGCTVGPGEGDLVCPCHASRYALTDAAVLAGPAPDPLPEIAVTVDGDDVVTAS